MPNSIREQILQAAVSRIAASLAPLGAEVHRSPTVALTREQAPAVVVFPESDEVIDRPNDRVERELVIRVVALARAVPPAAPETEADALLVAAHAALMEDPGLNGLALAVLELDCEWEVEDADSVVAAIPARYAIRYRTRAHDITQRG